MILSFSRREKIYLFGMSAYIIIGCIIAATVNLRIINSRFNNESVYFNLFINNYFLYIIWIIGYIGGITVFLLLFKSILIGIYRRKIKNSYLFILLVNFILILVFYPFWILLLPTFVWIIIDIICIVFYVCVLSLIQN